MQQKLKVIGFVKSQHDKSNSNHEAEIGQQYRLVTQKATEMNAYLVAIYGDKDLNGAPTETTIEDAMQAIENGQGEMLIVSDYTRLFTPKPFSNAILLSLLQRLKAAGASVEVASGPSVQSMADGPLQPLSP